MLLIVYRLIVVKLTLSIDVDIKKVLGKNVKAFREKKGWSQDDLSDISDLHRTYISGIERGTRNPTIVVVYKIANALTTTPAALLKLEDKGE
jgi:transcriptional regulator with XRE-family HTH domain